LDLLNSHPAAEGYMDLLAIHNLILTNTTVPTRPVSGTLLDHSIVSANFASETSTAIINSDLSDHDVVLVDLVSRGTGLRLNH